MLECPGVIDVPLKLERIICHGKRLVLSRRIGSDDAWNLSNGIMLCYQVGEEFMASADAKHRQFQFNHR